jgi:hypothetical protein
VFLLWLLELVVSGYFCCFASNDNGFSWFFDIKALVLSKGYCFECVTDCVSPRSVGLPVFGRWTMGINGRIDRVPGFCVVLEWRPVDLTRF